MIPPESSTAINAKASLEAKLSLDQLKLLAEQSLDAAMTAHSLASTDMVGAAQALRMSAFKLGDTLAATKLALQALEERGAPTTLTGRPGALKCSMSRSSHSSHACYRQRHNRPWRL